MNITVLGAGAWGTALARLLHHAHHKVTLWGHDREALHQIRSTGRNERYLPGIKVPDDLAFEENIESAIKDADLTLVAVPSKAFRDVTGHLAAYEGTIVSVTKGIEYETGLTMCGILEGTAP